MANPITGLQQAERKELAKREKLVEDMRVYHGQRLGCWRWRRCLSVIGDGAQEALVAVVASRL